MRRRSTDSIASRRSSASSSSSKSASRVTRNGWCARTSMPGKRASSLAAITCSSSTKRSPSGERRRTRGSSGGHLHAREPLVAARRVAHGDREVQRQVRDVGERVRGVDRQRREHREDRVGEQLVEVGAIVGRRGRPSRRSGCRASSSAGTHLVGEHRGRRGRRARRPGRGSTRSWSTRSRPSAVVVRRPASSCSMRPETRTSKNSSRFGAEDGEELGPLEQRQALVLGEGEDPGVEVEPRELAVQEALGRIGEGRMHVRDAEAVSSPATGPRLRPIASAESRSTGVSGGRR